MWLGKLWCTLENRAPRRAIVSFEKLVSKVTLFGWSGYHNPMPDEIYCTYLRDLFHMSIRETFYPIRLWSGSSWHASAPWNVGRGAIWTKVFASFFFLRYAAHFGETATIAVSTLILFGRHHSLQVCSIFLLWLQFNHVSEIITWEIFGMDLQDHFSNQLPCKVMVRCHVPSEFRVGVWGVDPPFLQSGCYSYFAR